MGEPVTVRGAAETSLGTLWARALDTRADHPVLADPTAGRAVAQLEYDVARLGIRPRDAISVAMRAKALDRWTRAFLDRHPESTVLHLGCGLDGRAERVGAGPGVRWYDVDQPEVVALRRRVLPPRPGEHLVGASVTDPGWLAEVPDDRPVLVVAEGLTMYLPAAQGPALLRRVVARFPRGGEMAFDTYSTLGVRLSPLIPVLRRTGARLDWGIDDPRALERQVPGLRLREAVLALRVADPADLARAPRTFRWQFAVLSRLPVVRRIGHLLRYGFGPDDPAAGSPPAGDEHPGR